MLLPFTTLKKNLKKDFSAFPTIRACLLGDSATQLLVQALRGTAYEYAFDLQIREGDFNQIERQLLDPGSEVYDEDPEVLILFFSAHKLLQKFNKEAIAERSRFALSEAEYIRNLIEQFRSRSRAKVILYNYPEIDDAVFGNYVNHTESSFLYQQRLLNLKLTELCRSVPGLYICDLSSLQNQIGKDALFNPSIYVNTEMVINVDALPRLAQSTLSILIALKGKLKKCLVLDLDNTLWGGVIGDDGLENIQIGSLGIGKAFTEFQYWIKKLKERGIILAVCSKNTEAIAKEPFEKHPDMVLRLEDFALFVANWENKADNIRRIRQVLNIGFDSMVFLDDNPFERNLVRTHIPEITVPELPEDPACYLEFLYTQNLFETVSFSEEDIKRTDQYRVEARRISDKMNFMNEADFLKSLDMKSDIQSFNPYNIPRVAQLSQRSNQFNLRTVRYTEDDVVRLANSDSYHPFTFSLEDKYGDNGLICVVVLRADSSRCAFIETWLMSCRVLKRGMEHFVLNEIVKFTKEHGFRFLQGEYIPTPKNGMVANHYKELGFSHQADGTWCLSLDAYVPLPCFITAK